MDFESIMKVIVMIAAGVAIPVAAYAAVVATRAIWVRPPRPEDDAGELDALRTRVAELEGMRTRMLELEERLDFTERMLVQQRDAARLPAGTEER